MKRLFKFFTILLATAILLIIIAFAAFVIYFKANYEGKVFPNVTFLNTKMTGMSFDDVEKEVEAKKKEFPMEITLKYDGKETQTKVSDLGFFWDSTQTIADIYEIGRGGNYIQNFFTFINQVVSSEDIQFQYVVDESKMLGYIKELANTIDKDPVDGKFEIQNNKVKDFKIGSDGQRLLVQESSNDVKKALIDKSKSIDLLVEKMAAKGVDDMEKMGVKELVATGESNFAGSPPNRIHNITVGAQVFNGILIKPGENFSFVTYLGDVSAKTGYLPELVIKEDKTIPEYGGGLCQVSTTFFRAAINAGFPILERTAHAYRVYYYEPAGFDSTIYDPKPDLVFKNDTEKYILVQTRIEGTKLLVDFYGTSDSRKVDVTAPTIYKYVQPGEPIIAETTDLAPGEKKQTDTAHVGADAYFDRTITYADGTKKEERFSSHYIPWRAKFLVGKEPEPEKPAEENPPATSASTNDVLGTDNASSDNTATP